jgi:hypothetical protein
MHPLAYLIGIVCLLVSSQQTQASESNNLSGAQPRIQTGIALTFIKGDSRNGSRTQVSIIGDSLQYSMTTYRASQAPTQSQKSVYLSAHRRIALKNVLGDLPRYPAFGSCFGKGMKYYLVETSEGKFYRSLPELSGRCYTQEPGIWSLFQDLDELVAPPTEIEIHENGTASAS